MDKRLRTSIVLLVLFALLSQGTIAVCSELYWEKLKVAAEAIRSIKADFTQTRQLEILEAPLISRGKFYFKAPDFLRWEYSYPLINVMLKQGNNISVYQFQEGAWKPDLTQPLEVRGMIFAEINRWLKGRFDKAGGFTPSYSPGPPVCITLTPNDEYKRFLNRIELVFTEKPGVIQSLEIIESEEAKTRIDFKNMEINSVIPVQIFEKP